MAESRLQDDILVAKAEIQRLRVSITAQQIHRENADRMCLASFVAGLSGVVGRQVRYAHPRTLQEVWNLALAVDEADRLQVAVLRLADPAKGFI